MFYGHYDVIRADAASPGGWNTDPFALTGINGYLYGRGVSDNKGPVLAALFAAGELAQQGELASDIVFLIEGEEESGSRGFAEAVRESKAAIGDVDWVLLANSYWIDDEVPCLTYGLRGVVHANVVVESDKPDLHSGVDGSRLNREPTIDLVNLLARLTDEKGAIRIPGESSPCCGGCCCSGLTLTRVRCKASPTPSVPSPPRRRPCIRPSRRRCSQRPRGRTSQRTRSRTT